ncbi:MAG TPA: SEC-C metal-binding domain-containing protein, partial [Fibrobacteraceae bacterium]|nr:SEC-C metal-binding domain-containing protein [Fibrobacteraceae bacterium]
YKKAGSELEGMTPDSVLDEVLSLCKEKYTRLESLIPEADFRNLERRVLLFTIDQHWRDHLLSMDYLREAIRFHGYAQKDPLMVYKKEGFDLFEKCMESIAGLVTTRMLNISIQTGNPAQAPVPQSQRPRQMVENTAEIKSGATQSPAATHPAPATNLPGTAPQSQQRKAPAPKVPVRTGPKPGRNDPCWCGSGLKYKKCHGKDED